MTTTKIILLGPTGPSHISLRDYWNWMNLQVERTHFTDGINGPELPWEKQMPEGEMHCYRFWYQGEVIHIQHSQEVKYSRLECNWNETLQKKMYKPYFMKWCWLVILEVRGFYAVSINTHEMIPYPGEGLTDIYIERGYDQDSI